MRGFSAGKFHAPALGAIFLLIIATGGGCGDRQGEAGTAALLPQKISTAGLERAAEVKRYVGDSLWAYIDGGAEVYYPYNFVEVATADYTGDGVEIVADIYKFATPTDAYGLYSLFRSADVKMLDLGTEGSLAAGQLQFVKGAYMGRLTAFDDADRTITSMTALAEKLAEGMPGPVAKPVEFGLLPDSGKIEPSDRYLAESFLQEKFLTKVFTRAYFLQGDTVTLFFSSDNPGRQILAWSKVAEQDSALSHLPADIPFDEGKGFIQQHKLYGAIIVGMKNHRMAGMVGYREQLKPFLVQWLGSLPE